MMYASLCVHHYECMHNAHADADDIDHPSVDDTFATNNNNTIIFNYFLSLHFLPLPPPCLSLSCLLMSGKHISAPVPHRLHLVRDLPVWTV